MKKHLFAAFVAALVVGGYAAADYIRVLESEQVRAKSIVVGDGPPATAPAVGEISATTFIGAVTGNVTGNVTGQAFGTVPTAQVIAEGGTIAADACGGIKRISSATAVTTDTTDTFTAPAAGNAGCIMQVCNVNASDAITLDDNALFNGSGIAGGTPGNTALGALDCVAVGSDGAVWSQLAPGSQN